MIVWISRKEEKILGHVEVKISLSVVSLQSLVIEFLFASFLTFIDVAMWRCVIRYNCNRPFLE